jgi:hypothetical protein
MSAALFIASTVAWLALFDGLLLRWEVRKLKKGQGRP